MPVYLFKKLGRYLGISTVTGDFYSLSRSAYEALGKWNKKLSSAKTVSPSQALQVGRSCNIPSEIIADFPVPSRATSPGEDKIFSGVTDITLNLTGQCNLRCAYCWNDYGRYSNRRFQEGGRAGQVAPREGREMSVETARRAIDRLVELRGRETELVVDFYGGEPLLNLETLRAAVGYCRGNEAAWNVHFHFLLATNGTLLTPALAEELIGKGVQIAVSVDGPRIVHDRNRPCADGSGSFEKIRANLAGMPARIRKRLVGRTTVTPAYPQMVRLYENLRRMGFERIELFESEDACHRLTPGREKLFFRTRRQHALLCREYEKLARLYIREAEKGRLDYSRTFFNRFFKLMQRLYYHHQVTGGCPAAKGQVAVASDGTIYPCTAFLGIKEFELGTADGGIDRRRYARFTRKVSRRFSCCSADCALYALCRTTGSCLNVNYYFNGDPAVPYRKSCDLFREKMELAIASLAILSERIPGRLEGLFGFDPAGRRGNKLY